MNNDVVFINLDELVDYAEQPFKVIGDDSMVELAESIKMFGVLIPIIVRQKDDNKYEIISGHRRKRASKIVGMNTIPAVVVKLNDDEAAILLVDSNLQREKLLPSERAYAYKLKLEALKHQGIKNEFTCGHDVHKLKSRDEICQAFW